MISWRSFIAFPLLAMLWYPSFADVSWKTVDSFTYDWMGDGKPYEFILDIPADYDSEGDFTRLRISRAGRFLLTVQDDDGIAKVTVEASEFQVKKLLEGNPVPSPHLLFTPAVRGSSKVPLLFLFGCAYASSPGSLHVLALGNNGIPKEILYLRNFMLSEACDLNRDGKLELVGKPCLSQSFGDDLFTYDPYHVYRFGTSATSPMRLDVALSKRYNLGHYYGWAGMKCREDIAVVLHPPGGGKPVIMETKKAMALKKDVKKGTVVPGGENQPRP
jgi:hypothetical protein